VKVQTLLADINGDQTPLYFNLVQGATLFVLLVVCANIANLQLPAASLAGLRLPCVRHLAPAGDACCASC